MIHYDKQAATDIEISYNTPDIAYQRLSTLQRLALNSGERVLDVGCGTGFLTRDLAMLVGESGYVLGVDSSPDMLEGARVRCQTLPQIELKQAGADAIPVADNSFDVLTCTQVLLYVPDVAVVLAELFRVLKPGGRIAIVETDWRGVILNSSDDALTRRVFGILHREVPNPGLPPRLIPLLRSEGFQAIRSEAIPIINTSMAPASFSTTVIDWFAALARQYDDFTAGEVDDWHEDLLQKARQGEYFFCINRFLFSAVK